MPTPKRPKTAPIAIRLTNEERAELIARAGRRSLSDYIRQKLFGPAARQVNAPAPATGARDLAHILAKLGHSNLGPSLRDLAMAAKIGALPLTPEVEEAIKSACVAVTEIRSELMLAVGLREDRAP